MFSFIGGRIIFIIHKNSYQTYAVKRQVLLITSLVIKLFKICCQKFEKDVRFTKTEKQEAFKSRNLILIVKSTQPKYFLKLLFKIL